MKKIMLLTDFSVKSRRAAEYAFHLANSTRTDLILFNAYVVPLASNVDGGMYQLYHGDMKAFGEESDRQLHELSDHLQSLRVESSVFTPKITTLNRAGSVADNICQVTEENNVSLIVMGNESRQNLLEKILFSNDSAKIIEKSNCPILMLTDNTVFKPYKSISLACEIMDFAHLKAIDFIADMASRFETEIAVVHVTDSKNTAEAEAEERQYTHSVGTFKSLIDYDNITWHKLIGKDVAEIIEKFSQFYEADMISIMHQKHPLLEKLLGESITKKLINMHEKPILIFPPDFQKEENEQSSINQYAVYNKS